MKKEVKQPVPATPSVEAAETPVSEVKAVEPKVKEFKETSEIIAPHSWYGDDVVLNGTKDGYMLLVKPTHCLSNSLFIYPIEEEKHFFVSKQAALAAWQEHQEAGMPHQLFSDKVSEKP